MLRWRFPRLTANSLVNRFFIASLFILPLFIIISGTLLLNAFQHSQVNAEEEKLQAHLYLLLSVTELDNSRPLLPEVLTEPRFNQQNSGLYAFINNSQQKTLWQSASAMALAADAFAGNKSFKTDQRQFIPAQLSEHASSMNILTYDVEWIDDNNNSTPLRFIVASDAHPLIAEIKSYRQRLWQSLGLMGFLLIASQLFIMRWGLYPLKRLATELLQLRQGKSQQLEGHYPIEIQPVITNFNSIVLQEKQQRERYRNTMADLAHSLKTPLAVIQSQLSEQPQKDQAISEQVERINQIITHQLQRAVIRVNQSPINHNTNKIMVKKVVDRLIKILSRVYQEKNVQLNNLCEQDSYFYGDEADLLEVLGNLLDNACKHGHNHVVITAENRNNSQGEDQLLVCISDNGKGVADSMQNLILQRGERADTAQPGQGIGLSVAVDIISSYGGEISVSNHNDSPHLEGACFCITFTQ